MARVQGRFGLLMAVKLVHGDAEARLERAGLTRVPTFGNLREHAEAWLLKLLRRCVTAGWVSFSGADRPVVILTEDGRAVMRGERPARLLLPPLEAGRSPVRGAPSSGPAERARARAARDLRSRAGPPVGAGAPGALDPAGEALFQALRRERLRVAQQEGVAPFIVASDRTLRDIALLRPRTMEELRLAHGIGSHKAERYGALLVEVVARHSAAPPRDDGR